MSVFRVKGSPFYQFDFWIENSRFHGSTKQTRRREAEQVEQLERDKALKQVAEEAKAGRGPMKFGIACSRYWNEVGQHHAGSKTTWRNLERLVKFFGEQKPIAEISSDDVAKLVAWRRGHKIEKHRIHKRRKPPVDRLVSPATVNRSTLEPLMKVMNRARQIWGVPGIQPIAWKMLRLAEPEERIRELYAEEADRLELETRDDYAPFFSFMEASGLRLRECLLDWSHVNWTEGVIERVGKGSKPVRVVMNNRIREILMPLRGHHPIAVFTYVCEKPPKGSNLKIGLRYPITYQGVKTYHRRRRKRAGVEDFRLHDYRHDLGTKMLRATGNLKAVQKALNHRSIKTTTRYAHVLDEDLRDAHDQVNEAKRRARDIGPKKESA